ncbi:hypothetical protein SISSUDRAFT_1125414 [Sistotremastrum suecicum HHB10207 ss-3]|uniref:F-box domain-containing protein n=1 Tax=Sistotremastrum suecicum HHB10207 ss-3 TaxID=1314776 RepID=A0A166HLU4_9AGAM|nr:hypothetical protein SISSUDRAFT_1125414 [Sistotremastrum suecicum HHB10207 ss-3]
MKSFEDLPPEMLSEIIAHYMSNPEEYATARKRRVHTVKIGLINARLRAVALSRHWEEIWSTIYLQWPKNLIELYVNRVTKGYRVYLDTREGGLKNNEARLDYCASFLTEKMDRVELLNVNIHHGLFPESLRLALQTPAPKMRSLIFNLGNEVQNFNVLFNHNAPLLQSAHICAAAPLNIHSFTAITALKMKIGHETIGPLLTALAVMPQLEDLSLRGSGDTFEGVVFATERITLPNCHSFSTRHMEANLIAFILSSLALPALQHLVLYENTFCKNTGRITTMLPILHTVLGPGISVAPSAIRDTLFIEIQPYRAFLKMPGFHLETDLAPLRTVSLADPPEVLSTLLSEFLTRPARHFEAHPTELVIRLNINKTSRNENKTSLARVSMLKLMRDIFTAYPSVHRLRLEGRVNKSLASLIKPHNLLPDLSELEIGGGTDVDTFEDRIRGMFPELFQARNLHITCFRSELKPFSAS